MTYCLCVLLQPSLICVCSQILDFQASFIYVHLVMQPDSHLSSYRWIHSFDLWSVSGCCIFHRPDSGWLEVSTHSPTLKESKVASVSQTAAVWGDVKSYVLVFTSQDGGQVSLSSPPGCSFQQVKCCKGRAPVSLTSCSCQGFNLTETCEAETQLCCITHTHI